MTVPDEAVEAAAKALAIVAWGEWEYVPTALRGRMRRDARITLEAAAPFIAAQALANAISYADDQAMAGAYFPDWQNCADMMRAIPNPYRSGT